MLLQKLATGANGVKQARYRRRPTRGSEALARACAVVCVGECIGAIYIEVFVKWYVYMQYNNNISLTADDSLPVLKMKKIMLLFHRSLMS